MKKLFLALFSFYSFTLIAEPVWSDKYLFIVGDMAIRESQIEMTKTYLKVMACANPQGILPESFKELWQRKSEARDFIPFYQLMVYSNSYKIQTENKVTSLYRTAIREKNCDPHKKVDVTSSFFQKFIELEIFLRSRYLPGQSRGQESLVLKEGSLKALLESLKDQIKTQEMLEN